MAIAYPMPGKRRIRRGDIVRRVLRRCGMAAVARDDPPPHSATHGNDQAATEGSTIEEFESFFRRYEPLISGYLRRMIGDEQAAYDISQESFFRAWQHFAEIKEYPNPRSWLFRVATNLAINHLRHARIVGVATPLDEENAPAGDDPTAHVAERDLVQQTLLLLPPKQRALLVLHEVYGLTCEEAGNLLGLSHAAARTQICRAREQFRQLYLRK
ncbi:MAG TPA: RNA polymerase sigma factor, partial [Ktedonobacterales bacterium]|nr:RNA polymerase sigma factor [Ktedonobacterales bacterium]